MDNRLFKIYGSRPQRLTRNEVPALARGIVAVLRGRASVDRYVIHDIPCTRLFNPGGGINILVRSDDWVKVVPYLKDGTLDTTQFPVNTPGVLYPNTFFDPSASVIWDTELYERVVTILLKLFTIEFPVSNI